MLKKFLKIFYSKKQENGYTVTKILFWKKKKLPKLTRLCALNIKNVGRQTYGQEDTMIVSPDTSVGSFCSIGLRVVLGAGEHPLNFLSTSPYFFLDNLGFKNKEVVSHHEYKEVEPITIGNDVWIGDGAFIKNGIKVGDGAVIGARSIVTKDVPPYAIVAGCPARIIRYRFDEQTINTLLELKWWELPDEVIKKIKYDNMNEAIKFIKTEKEKHEKAEM